MIYRVWDPEDCDEDGAREVMSRFSVADTAHWFATVHDRDDWNAGDLRTYHVRDEAGVLWSVEVRAEMEPVFRAGEPRRVVDKGCPTR